MNLICPLCNCSHTGECPEEFCTEANLTPCITCLKNLNRNHMIAYLTKIRSSLINLYER